MCRVWSAEASVAHGNHPRKRPNHGAARDGLGVNMDALPWAPTSRIWVRGTAEDLRREKTRGGARHVTLASIDLFNIMYIVVIYIARILFMIHDVGPTAVHTSRG